MNDDEYDELLYALEYVFGAGNVYRIGGRMTGFVVKVLGPKKFGFIKGENGTEYFFHSDNFNGFFEDLVTDMELGKKKIRVEFEIDEAPYGKGPRAKEVTRVDGGV